MYQEDLEKKILFLGLLIAKTIIELIRAGGFVIYILNAISFFL